MWRRRSIFSATRKSPERMLNAERALFRDSSPARPTTDLSSKWNQSIAISQWFEFVGSFVWYYYAEFLTNSLDICVSFKRWRNQEVCVRVNCLIFGETIKCFVVGTFYLLTVIYWPIYQVMMCCICFLYFLNHEMHLLLVYVYKTQVYVTNKWLKIYITTEKALQKLIISHAKLELRMKSFKCFLK